MAEYQESTDTALSWQRCVRFTFFNEQGQTPVLECREERVVVVASEVVAKRDIGAITFDLDGPYEFDLLSLTTGEPTGSTATQTDLRRMILSLYRAKAADRDAA